MSIHNYSFYNDDQCSAVICVSKKSKCIICNVYRPPTTTDSSFSNLLNFIRNFIQLYNVLDKFQLFIFGDFNLPNFCWDDFGKSTCSIPTGPSYALFQTFMEDYFLSQYVKQKTRKNNILDLFLTNDPTFVHMVECTNLNISDHLMVKIYTNFFSFLSSGSKPHKVQDCLDFSVFNLQRANFGEINNEIASIDWDELISKTSIEEFPEIFNHLIYSVLQKNCPVVNRSNKSFKSSYRKQREILSRKIRKLRKLRKQIF